jgi:hypothetical protein
MGNIVAVVGSMMQRPRVIPSEIVLSAMTLLLRAKPLSGHL